MSCVAVGSREPGKTATPWTSHIAQVVEAPQGASTSLNRIHTQTLHHEKDCPNNSQLNGCGVSSTIQSIRKPLIRFSIWTASLPLLVLIRFANGELKIFVQVPREVLADECIYVSR